MSATLDRKQRLQSLQDSTKKWAEEARTGWKNTATRCKSLLRGRTGSERLNDSLVAATTELATEEINAFLEG